MVADDDWLGIFGLLLYGSFSGGRDFSWSGRRAMAAVAVAAMYSLSDEFHQLFVPGRGASLWDCGLDTLGTTLGILLLYARARLLPAKASSTAAVEASAAEK
ncbi:MAG: VanZ family protein [Acidobacteriia bacterium]|nr:VanZ family protein [Terriglobia bacterium]